MGVEVIVKKSEKPWTNFGMKIDFGFRRWWMLAGFAAAFLIGDMLLYVREARPSSIEFLFGVAGYALAHLFWMVGQFREARPDGRVFLSVVIPLLIFVLVRLRPPVLPHAAWSAACAYAMLTAVSFATALATRRVFYILGIGLLFFSDMMIGGGMQGASCCNWLIRPTYIASEMCIFASFICGDREWRIPVQRLGVFEFAVVGGVLSFGCFFVAALKYPGGGYNPFMQMLSALGLVTVKDIVYPSCHFWFIAGMVLAAVSVSRVWTSLSDLNGGWRRIAIGWGGAVNVAGLLSIALVPFDVNGDMHNIACNLAVVGGVPILAARFRKGGDLVWTCYLLALVAFFAICVEVKSIPFCPWVTATQKVLVVSFAVWSGWIAWWTDRDSLMGTDPKRGD